MRVEITIKNYRCFPDARLAKFTVSSGLTAFVGVNNSGKSSILKFFYEFRNLFRTLGNSLTIQQVTQQGHPANLAVPNPAAGSYDAEEIFSNTNDRAIVVDMKFDAGVNEVDGARITLSRSNTYVLELFSGDRSLKAMQNLRMVNQDIVAEDDRLTIDTSQFRDVCRALSETFYVGAFRNILNVGANSNYFDIQVGQAFVQTWRNMKTGSNVAQSEATQRVTQDVRRIFRFSQLEINAYVDESTLQFFVNNKSYKLPALGAGIAQFVLVLANAAVRRPTFILIDEPELNLHPSLQLDFLTSLASYASEGVMFGTHSIGLARAAAPDRIYALQARSDGPAIADFEAVRNLAEYLGELSFSGYRAVGFNVVLLVEGRHDVKTFHQVLRRYSVDHEVVVVPLGGGEMINAKAEAELCELRRLSDHVFAVIDSEKASEVAELAESRRAFLAACEKTGITAKVLDRRALENYLTDRAIKLVFPNLGGLAPFQLLSEIPHGWSKADSWRIAREMSRGEIDDTDLGEFVRQIVRAVEEEAAPAQAAEAAPPG